MSASEDEEEFKESFESFYNRELLPILKELDSERKSIKSTILYPTVGIGTLGLGLIAVIPKLGLQTLIMGAIAGAGLFTWYKGKAAAEFRAEFKNRVIRSILKHIDTEKEMRYSGFGRMDRGEFVNCGIVTEQPDRYKGDDLVSGTIESTEFSFSEIHAEKYRKDSKGRRRLTTLFKGLFFKADFNKDFNGRTVVVPDIAEKLLGDFGQQLQKYNFARAELVQLENPDFEKRFAVYSDNQQEARYILSPALMERIYNFTEKHEISISLSFHNSKVYVAIPMSKDFFEPSIFRTLVNYDRSKEYFDEMQLAISLVEELNLNTRIWTKPPKEDEEEKKSAQSRGQRGIGRFGRR